LVISPGKQSGIEGAEFIGPNSKVARILGQVPRRATWNDIVKFEPDLVFVQFAIAAMSVNLWPIISLCKKFAAARIPVVVAYHEPAREYDLLGFVTRRIYQAMVRVTDVPIVFSLAGRQALIENDLFNEVVEVSHGTTGVARITDEDVRRVRDHYRVHKPLVLTLGFTNADKGTDVLLHAASAIAVDQGNDVQFLIAGSPRKRRGVFRIMERRDIKCQQRLEDQAKNMVNVDVAFSGFVADQDVAALLFVADVVVLPYRRITQSGIANLALSSRSVIVASDLPGLRSDLGDAAKYVEVGDSRAMAGQIVSLMGNDNASARKHMRKKSEERAMANTFARVADQILSAGLAHRGTRDST
jgi:glycosyltransferase involved in cell wall biosynthesis